MHDKLLTLRLHISKLITQIPCSHLVATGNCLSILCCLPSLLRKSCLVFSTRIKLRQTMASEAPNESSQPWEGLSITWLYFALIDTCARKKLNFT